MANQVKLKATDTLHISSVKADSIRPGEQFTVSADTAKSLIERGLATPANKAAPRPRNQAARPTSNKGRGR